MRGKADPPGWPTSLQLCSPVPLPQVGVTIATTPLLQALGISLPAVSHNRELLKSDFVAEGATHKNSRGSNIKKTWSMLACRQGRCRRHLRLGRAALISRGRAAGIYYFPARGTSGWLNVQLPLIIPSSAASACEQAVSRELLLPLTRDTVLAAVPWLRSSAKAQH